MISSLLQRANGCYLLFRRLPELSVNAGSSFSSVFCHSSDRKGFAAQRVGKQALQRFDSAPLACLSCLRDTGLEPMNISLRMTPVHLVPCERGVGGRRISRN